MFAPETFGKVAEWENNLVLSLLPGSHKCHALRETVQPVPETWGHMYNALPWSAQGIRTREREI
jgi:hypothetical protein